MLGNTVPEPTSERITQYVCSAGLELDDEYRPKGLVRLYPLGLRNVPPRWSISHVDVVRHERDNRQETWRPISAFGSIGNLPRSERANALDPFLVSSINEANERRLSLAMIKLNYKPQLFLEDTLLDDEPSYNLFDDDGQALKARERFPHIPRLRFETASSWSKHELQIRDWGTWELMRKNHEKIASLSHEERVRYVDNPLHIRAGTYLFVGNFANHRISWMIISVLNL